MLAERGDGNGADGEIAVPPTIQALLAARLDQPRSPSARSSVAPPSSGRSSSTAPKCKSFHPEELSIGSAARLASSARSF